jgi:hypothetical protein
MRLNMKPKAILRSVARLLITHWLRGGRISRAAAGAWEGAGRDPETQYRRIEAGRMRP